MNGYLLAGFMGLAIYLLWRLERRVAALAENARVEVLYAQALAQANDRVQAGFRELQAKGLTDRDGSWAAALRALSGIDGRAAQLTVVQKYCNLSTSHEIGWSSESGEEQKHIRAAYGHGRRDHKPE